MNYFRALLLLVGVLSLPLAAAAAPAEPPAGVTDPVAAAPAALRLPTGERLVSLAAGHDDESNSMVFVAPRGVDPRRIALSALDLATGVVQGYDGFLTLRVMKAGGIETNPLVKPVANNQNAMMALKMAAAVSTVIGVESLWRRDHRVGAIVASVVANSAMAMVAHHNAKVLARLQGR